MSNIPPADFSQIIPQGPSDAGETSTDPSHAREPLPHQPLVTTLPTYDPSKNLADQIAQVLGEGPVQHNEQVITTGTEFPSQSPPAPAPQPPQEPTQQPASTSPPAPQSPVQGEGEGGSDAVSGSSAAPPDSPSEDEPSTFSLDALAQQLYGRPVSQEEATAIIQLWRDASALTPAQKHQVAVAMGYVEDDTQPPPTAPQPPQPTQQFQPTGQPLEPGNDDDPYIAPHIAPLRNELGQLRDQVQHLVTDRQLSEQQQLERQANEALNSFRESHAELTEEEHTALRLRARDRGVLAATYQRTGDLTTAINDALEYEMWQDPNLRAKALQVQAEQQRVQESADIQRQQRAASLGPGGSQVPREPDDTPQQPRVLDRHQARAAMVADLAQHFNQQP